MQLQKIPRIALQYLDHPDTGPLLNLAWGQRLQDDTLPSHAWVRPTFVTPSFAGEWFLACRRHRDGRFHWFPQPPPRRARRAAVRGVRPDTAQAARPWCQACCAAKSSMKATSVSICATVTALYIDTRMPPSER